MPFRDAALRALIYLRDLDDGPACIDYCRAMGYRVRGVVYDPDGTKYAEVREAMRDRGEAEILVVHDYADLPQDRLPRLEIVSAAPARPPEIPRQRSGSTPLRRRRPRPIR